MWDWLRVVIYLVVPVVWGIGSAWLFDKLSAWRRARRENSAPGLQR